MVKVVYCITRKPGLSEEEFFRYWREVHGPIGAHIPGLRRLVQCRRVNVPGDRSASYDGVAELWFDSADDLVAARSSAEWAASSEDERHFVDPARSAYLVTEETSIRIPETGL